MLTNIARGCTCARTKHDMPADIEHMNWIDSRMNRFFLIQSNFIKIEIQPDLSLTGL